MISIAPRKAMVVMKQNEYVRRSLFSFWTIIRNSVRAAITAKNILMIIPPIL